MNTIPKMISGDWHPTADPTGRHVQFNDFSGTVMKGTVTAVEYEEDHEATLYIEAVAPDGSRRGCGVNAGRVTWLDADLPAWAESEHPTGRWVIFHDQNGVERCGTVVDVDSCHSTNAFLTVMQLKGPGGLRFIDVPWRSVGWLPE